MRGCRLVVVSVLISLVFWVGPGWAQQPKPGGTLRIALPGDPAFYNAHQGPAMGAQAQPFQGAAIFGNFVPPARSNDPMEEGQRCR